MFLLCSRYPQSFLDLISRKSAIVSISRIFRTSKNPELIQFSSNLILLLASSNAYTKFVVEQGGEQLIKYLVLMEILLIVYLNFSLKIWKIKVISIPG